MGKLYVSMQSQCLFFVLGATVISWMCKNEEHIFVRSVT